MGWFEFFFWLNTLKQMQSNTAYKIVTLNLILFKKSNLYMYGHLKLLLWSKMVCLLCWWLEFCLVNCEPCSWRGDFNGNIENCGNEEECTSGGMIGFDETNCESKSLRNLLINYNIDTLLNSKIYGYFDY